MQIKSYIKDLADFCDKWLQVHRRYFRRTYPRGYKVQPAYQKLSIFQKGSIWYQRYNSRNYSTFCIRTYIPLHFLRNIKGRISSASFSLRIRETSTARYANTREAGPFQKLVRLKRHHRSPLSPDLTVCPKNARGNLPRNVPLKIPKLREPHSETR